MAWKPKTIFGKIVKGAAIAGGSILGLSVGVGAVSGIVKGTGALAGISKSVGGIKPLANTLKNSAAKLITGKTQEERQLINAQKELTKAEAHKLELVQDLIDAGATPESARAQVGLSEVELASYKGETLNKSSFGDLLKNPIMLAVAGLLLAFVILPKKR
jgi:hypothetical protein